MQCVTTKDYIFQKKSASTIISKFAGSADINNIFLFSCKS